MARRVRPLAALAAAIAVMVAGCGGGTETVTTVENVQAPTQPTIDSTAPKELQPPTSSTPTPPTGSGGTRAEAADRVRQEGYRPDDLGQYEPSNTLRVLVGTRADSGDGYAKRAFFFVGGRYIGTDTSDDSAGIRVEGQSGTTVTLAYAIYQSNDALCCPSSSSTVRYQWNGSRLVPLDPIPSRSGRGRGGGGGGGRPRPGR